MHDSGRRQPDHTEDRYERANSNLLLMLSFYGVARRERCWFSVGASPARQLVAPAGSNRSGGGGNEAVEAFDGKGRFRRLREQAGRNVSER